MWKRLERTTAVSVDACSVRIQGSRPGTAILLQSPVPVGGMGLPGGGGLESSGNACPTESSIRPAWKEGWSLCGEQAA